MSCQEDIPATGTEEANCGWQSFVQENLNKSCGCVERAIMEADIKIVAEAKRKEDGVEKCHGGEIDRAWCPEG